MESINNVKNIQNKKDTTYDKITKIKKKKILIYFGVFNPATTEHIKLGLETLAKLKLDKVVFVPMNNNYINYIKRKNVLPEEIRYNMLVLSIKELKLTCLEVNRYETKSNSPYIYDLFQYYKKNYKNEDLYFLIGDDNLAKIQD